MSSPHRHWIFAACLIAGAAAAEPDVDPDMHAHMDDDPLVGMVLFDQLEWQQASPDDFFVWDTSAWFGQDNARVALRAEGELADGKVEDSRTELLGWKPIAPWWNLVAGVRQDAGEGPGRTYALIGLEGLAPYWFHVEGDLFAGEGGQFGTRLEAEYDLLLTNHLVLQPRAELEVFGDDDRETGIGSGFSKIEVGLRLRYEIRREFAPYVGIEWGGALGDTADVARAAGEDVRDTRVVAGLRVWY